MLTELQTADWPTFIWNIALYRLTHTHKHNKQSNMKTLTASFTHNHTPCLRACVKKLSVSMVTAETSVKTGEAHKCDIVETQRGHTHTHTLCSQWFTVQKKGRCAIKAAVTSGWTPGEEDAKGRVTGYRRVMKTTRKQSSGKTQEKIYSISTRKGVVHPNTIKKAKERRCHYCDSAPMSLTAVSCASKYNDWSRAKENGTEEDFSRNIRW